MASDEASKTVIKRGATALNVNIVRQAREIMLKPAMFVADPNGRQVRVSEDLPDGKLSFHYLPMNVHALRTLIAIITLMQGTHRGEVPARYASDDDSAEADETWLALGDKARPSAGKACRLRVTRRQIAELVSGSRAACGATALDAVMESLLALQRVQIHFKANNRRGEFAMTLIGAWSRTDDYVNIAVNPRLVEAVMERTHGKYSLFSAQNVRELRPIAALLYYRLCATIDPGKSLAISENKLMSYIWMQPPAPGKERTTMDSRRRYLTAALKEISGLSPPWVITKKETDHGAPRAPYLIKRPDMVFDEGSQVVLNLLP